MQPCGTNLPLPRAIQAPFALLQATASQQQPPQKPRGKCYHHSPLNEILPGNDAKPNSKALKARKLRAKKAQSNINLPNGFDQTAYDHETSLIPSTSIRLNAEPIKPGGSLAEVAYVPSALMITMMTMMISPIVPPQGLETIRS